jgi:thioredoxin-dependent peroxiredoxin
MTEVDANSKQNIYCHACYEITEDDFMLQVGDKFPDFSLRDQDGKERTRDDLLDFYTVLFFYLKDDAPGCTKEACDFSTMLKDITSKTVQVMGVSTDSLSSHKSFSEKYRLNYYLLSDEFKTLCKKCGLLKEKSVLGSIIFSVERTTYIIDKAGNICWVESPVSLENHVSRTSSALKKFLLQS